MALDVLAHAVDYATRGWRVLPIAPRGKVPLTSHGCLDASADEGLVRQWWARWPDANVAIATGAASGLVVLDVDVSDDKRGDRTLVELVAAHGGLGGPDALEPTSTAYPLHAITGSGGSHYYFAHPGGRVGNSAGRLGPGLDTRGDGGYVVAPPSLHASGERYSWCPGGELAPMPAWLLAMLRPVEVVRPLPPRPAFALDRRTLGLRAMGYLATMAPSISGAGGHDAAMDAAVAMVCGFNLSPRDAMDLLVYEFNPRCVPPWSERELRHKVDSAEGADRVGRGYLLDRGL